MQPGRVFPKNFFRVLNKVLLENEQTQLKGSKKAFLFGFWTINMIYK